ncbi:5-formyltetrahydrofolate cyclo-ligase [Dermacoccaceae bacterium W4C1]
MSDTPPPQGPHIRATAAESKPAVRGRLRAARRQRLADAGERAGASRARQARQLAAHLSTLLDRLPAQAVTASFTALPTEPETAAVNAALASRGPLLLPVLLPDSDLSWADQSGVDRGRAAIADAELILLPALAVATDGARLGQGGGSYDRALARVGPRTLLVALVHDGEVLDHVPTESHDRLVHGVCTPTAGLRMLRPPPPPAG